MMQLKSGQQVTVTEFGGGQLDVVVLADRGRVVVVCNPQEFNKAKAENREPEGVGFPRKDVSLTSAL